MDIPIAILIGLVAGLLGGLLGIGGGVVMIPGMVLLLGTSQHTAQGVSLAAITATAMAGATTHYFQKNVKLSLALAIAPAAVAFALLGAWLADRLSAILLTRVFAVLLLLVGLRLILRRKP